MSKRTKKTLTINNPKHVADGCRLYLTNGGNYGVTGYGSRWWIIDINRNFESDWGFISKREALQEANTFEQQQTLEEWETDGDVYDKQNENVNFRSCFGLDALYHRYNPDNK